MQISRQESINRDIVAIAANPFSGALANQRRVEELADALTLHGLTPRVAWTLEERAGLFRDTELMARCRCVVAAGGDGTVADLINEQPAVPIAVLPLGTENLFARAFDFPRKPETLARRIVSGQCRAIDLGRLGERFFALMVGVGIDAEIAHRLGRWRVGRHGLRRVTYLSYAAPILSAMWGYRYPEVVVEADGECFRGTHAFVFNVRRYAVGLKLAPTAQEDDGLLDWVVLERPGRFNLMRYAWFVLRRTHLELTHVRHGRAKQVRITCDQPAPVQLDGDPHGTTPILAEVVPAALRVIV